MKRAFILVALIFSACATETWVRSADEEVSGVLDEKRVGFDEFRAKGLIQPEPADDEDQTQPIPAGMEDLPREVGLAESLMVATRLNRGYISQKESLYLSALSLTTVRSQFSPVFSGSIAAILSDTDATDRTNTNTARLGVSQILPTGGTIAVDGRFSTNSTGGAYDTDTGVTVSLDQPLLRGAGYETSHEALTQAERNVVYAIRDFELFREDFTISIMSQYYSLVRQLRGIEIAEEDEKSRFFLTEQSNALFEVGEATEVDKLRAEREYLRVQSDLLTLREAYKLSLDRFKIQLGLPTSYPLVIRAEDPVYSDVSVDLESAAEAALHNRLDLINVRDRLDDAEREVRISTNRMLPDLDLDARYTRTSLPAPFPDRLAFLEDAYVLGLTLEIPLERTAERNALRRSLIELNRSQRDLTLAEDNVILEVRESLRRLRRVRSSIDLRRQEIAASEKEAMAAQFRFDEGEADNQDVSVAQAAVGRAKNSYIADLVEYEEARIDLLRDVGILFIDEKGMWVEP